jgi:hypothetical protein
MSVSSRSSTNTFLSATTGRDGELITDGDDAAFKPIGVESNDGNVVNAPAPSTSPFGAVVMPVDACGVLLEFRRAIGVAAWFLVDDVSVTVRGGGGGKAWAYMRLVTGSAVRA